MNIVQANSVPLREILQHIGCCPVNEKPRDLFYLAPWRAEKTASFYVNIPRNVWYDHGEGIGGDVVAFACMILEKASQSCRVTDALEWIEKTVGGAGHIALPRSELICSPTSAVNTLELKTIAPIRHIALVRYLESRRISLTAARRIYREAWLHNHVTGKNFFALALQNEDDGYELRNPFFKGSLSPKTITFIRGQEVKPDCIHLFEGAMDYLSLLTRQDGNPLNGDAIILNSLACLKHAHGYIKNYGYRVAHSWFDNDAAGVKSRELFDAFVKTEDELAHLPMNAVYAPYKDVNEWHVATPGMAISRQGSAMERLQKNDVPS